MRVRYFTIPNIITLTNLAFGTAAVALSASGAHCLRGAFWCIAAAAVADFLDGFAARLLKQYSPLGVQLDSLADMVSFGLAPTMIMAALYRAAEPAFDFTPAWTGWVVVLIVLFSALRLARFNIDEEQHAEFIGLPTPACALLCASLGYLSDSGMLVLPREAVAATALVAAVLLISPVRMFSLKFSGFGWRPNALRYIFLALCATAVALLRAYSVPAIIVMYIAISAVRHAVIAAGTKESGRE